MATIIPVSTDAQLRAAILEASDDFVQNGVARGGPYTIDITGDFTLAKSLPMIRGDAINAITISGNGHKIDASGLGRVFFVESGKVAINDLTIAHAIAQGGAGGQGAVGGGGAGGGLGAGAALFVNTGATVTVTGVHVLDAAAVGGAGGTLGSLGSGGGGGGGLGGNGGCRRRRWWWWRRLRRGRRRRSW